MKNQKEVPQMDQQQERIVVASILFTKGENFAEINKIIQPSDVWDKEARECYADICALQKKGGAIDIVSLEADYTLRPWLIDAIGSVAGRAGAVKVWTKKIKEESQKRKISQSITKIQTEIGDKKIGEVVKELSDSLAELDKQEEKALSIFSYNDLIKEDLGETPFIVEKLIPGEGITMVSGPPASFKTFILLDMILAIASGSKVWGVLNTIQTPVLIMDEESGKRILQNRFKVLQNNNPVENLPIFMSSYSNLSFTETDLILNFCLENGIKMVCFDSFVRFLGSIDENSSTEIKQVFQNLKKLCAVGIAVVIVHHHRKSMGFSTGSKEEMRGSSDILAATHSHIVFERSAKEPSIIVRQQKLREDVERNPFILAIENPTPETIKFVYRGDVDEKKNITEKASDAIFELLGSSEMPTAHIIELLKQSGIGESSCRIALKQLVDEGKITRNSYGSTKGNMYRKTELPEEQGLDEEVSIDKVLF